MLMNERKRILQTFVNYYKKFYASHLEDDASNKIKNDLNGLPM